ncbi:MAG: hypothetical protein HY554_06425 [Elusimicrobia bacterium]|nr:hypothetical protein [Elusimicrobiota bacterium]
MNTRNAGIRPLAAVLAGLTFASLPRAARGEGYEALASRPIADTVAGLKAAAAGAASSLATREVILPPPDQPRVIKTRVSPEELAVLLRLAELAHKHHRGRLSVDVSDWMYRSLQAEGEALPDGSLRLERIVLAEGSSPSTKAMSFGSNAVAILPDGAIAPRLRKRHYNSGKLQESELAIEEDYSQWVIQKELAAWMKHYQRNVLPPDANWRRDLLERRAQEQLTELIAIRGYTTGRCGHALGCVQRGGYSAEALRNSLSEAVEPLGDLIKRGDLRAGRAMLAGILDRSRLPLWIPKGKEFFAEDSSAVRWMGQIGYELWLTQKCLERLGEWTEAKGPPDVCRR